MIFPDSPDWAVRAAAGRQLAASDDLDEVADLLHRLLLDPHDTGVTGETAAALLQRRDTAGLRHVLRARNNAAESCTAEELQAALHCNPEWTTEEGTDRLITQLRSLAADHDADVSDEAAEQLKPLGR
ncbi:hypothetical protein [Actinoplanes flavus]|uniref:HEAT repeat-containing protein n=1 Tax=Actinoplanes flavus TaxID=2820290 RepID=A0ABS3UWZ6_9ACTN|nr:hypothetical protein [Actinoplanes flavus]MBO3743084.1 hypothetical protein [Actinoplanes flavus]